MRVAGEDVGDIKQLLRRTQRRAGRQLDKNDRAHTHIHMERERGERDKRHTLVSIDRWLRGC